MQGRTIQFSNATTGSTSVCTIDANGLIGFNISQPPAPPSFAAIYWPHALLLVVWLVICLVWRNTGRIDTADTWYEDDGQINSQDARDFRF
jgi:hypothetical protein